MGAGNLFPLRHHQVSLLLPLIILQDRIASAMLHEPDLHPLLAMVLRAAQGAGNLLPFRHHQVSLLLPLPSTDNLSLLLVVVSLAMK